MAGTAEYPGLSGFLSGENPKILKDLRLRGPARASRFDENGPQISSSEEMRGVRAGPSHGSAQVCTRPCTDSGPDLPRLSGRRTPQIAAYEALTVFEKSGYSRISQCVTWNARASVWLDANPSDPDCIQLSN